MGPLELLAVRFPGNHFRGEIAESLAEEIKRFREQVVAAGREANAVTVMAPGRVAVVKDVEAQRQTARETLAFYVARMGDYYYQQLSDMDYAEDCNAIRAAWRDGGSKAGYAAVSDRLLDSLWCITASPDEARERLGEQEEAGVDMHSVLVRMETDADAGRVFEVLLK